MPHLSFPDALAERTARQIVARFAGDCADAPALRAAIARLARAALEAQVRLFERNHLPAAVEETAAIHPYSQHLDLEMP